MFRKIRDRILTLEVVLDALIELLHKKAIIHRDEIQLEILARAGDKRIPRLKRKFKLSEIPMDSKIYGYEISGEDEGTVIIFKHLDGVSSHCHVEGKPEKIVHLSPSTPLVKYKDGFKLDEKE